VDGIECDVRLTRDGHPVVFHDNNLARMGAGSQFIHEITLNQLREITLTHPITGKTATIPTLLEACEHAKGRGLMNFELKNYSFFDRRLEKSVLKVIKTFDMDHECLVSSFSPLSLRYCARKAPHIQRALLVYERQSRPNRRGLWAPWARANILNPSKVLVTEQSIDRFRKKGYKLIIWTINDIDEARALAHHNVHGIITDYPDKIIKGLEGI
jgi:glycerophosphoryl diester phosphodiesterase